MSITAEVIKDSISPKNIRLTTFQLRYPRFIHAELMTHRVFSRNASSSRAIPVERMIEDMRRDPAKPIYWGANQPGMQAQDELSEEEIEICEDIWLNAMETAIDYARSLVDLNLHKQIANRILEPWAHINVVVTATDYENFYALRCHADAQPEMKALGDVMRYAQGRSEPTLLQPGEWHLPYINGKNFMLNIELQKKISVARCARVSYLTHDGRQTTPEADEALFRKLMVGQPLHASPAEHQATPDLWFEQTPDSRAEWYSPNEHGNLRGWIQFRKTLEGEFKPG